MLERQRPIDPEKVARARDVAATALDAHLSMERTDFNRAELFELGVQLAWMCFTKGSQGLSEKQREIFVAGGVLTLEQRCGMRREGG